MHSRVAIIKLQFLCDMKERPIRLFPLARCIIPAFLQCARTHGSRIESFYLRKKLCFIDSKTVKPPAQSLAISVGGPIGFVLAQPSNRQIERDRKIGSVAAICFQHLADRIPILRHPMIEH